jgi:hypothetical protein
MWNSNIKLLNYFIVILLYGLLYSPNAYCKRDSAKVKFTIVYDSSKVEIRKLNEIDQQKLLNNADYKYGRTGPAPKSLWERIKEWFWRKIDELFNTKGGHISLKVLEYLLIAAAIVVIIFLLFKNNVRSLFYGKSASVPIDFKEFEEDIHKINFEELIATAISKKDFRKAVRLHFLNLLKELTDKNLIKWQIDKTNNDYSMELAQSRYSSQFKELSLLYEYIWYGDFQIDETNFKTTVSKFKEFKI